jgi:hypothetical protein
VVLSVLSGGVALRNEQAHHSMLSSRRQLNPSICPHQTPPQPRPDGSGQASKVDNDHRPHATKEDEPDETGSHEVHVRVEQPEALLPDNLFGIARSTRPAQPRVDASLTAISHGSSDAQALFATSSNGSRLFF